MKRSVLIFLTTMFALGMAGCGKAADTDKVSPEPEEETVSVSNPWKDDVSTEEVANLVNTYFIVPEGAEDVTYRIDESDRLAEMDFTLDDLKFCARMKPTEALEDISGMYYKWDAELDDSIYGAEAKFRSAVSDSEMIHSVIWFDKSGMSYSLTTSDKDLDGFDITAIVEAMYQPGESND